MLTNYNKYRTKKNLMKKILTPVLAIFIIAAFSFTIKTANQNASSGVCDSLNISAQEHLMMSVLWYQKSAEMKAMYYQSYNMAKMALDNNLKKYPASTKKAVALDIDETVLDNSPYQAVMIKKGFPFSAKTWKEWTGLAIAKALPGVVDFLNYAKSKGVEAFFVSNRDLDERDATIKNMIIEKIPFADTMHVLLRVNGKSNKTERYNKVEKTHKIILTIGDNLRDYNEIFGNRNNNFGINMADSLKNTFGDNFIILPNPMYGDWEKAIYKGKFPGEVEKNKIRREALIGY